MLSLICNRASICKQSVKALMGISTEFYSDKIDINFIDVNAKSLWPFSTFVDQVLKFYSHFACSERLRKFPIKYGDLYICGRGVRKLPVNIDTVIIVAYDTKYASENLCTGRSYLQKVFNNHKLRDFNRHKSTGPRPVIYSCNKSVKWQGLSVDIKILSPGVCLPCSELYTCSKTWKKCIKSDFKDIFLKLATNEWSDKTFLLTSKLCPMGAVCPCPGAIH